MKLHQLFLTKNPCYIAGKPLSPKGIMVHSTGANNPYIKRYVGPDDGLLGKNQYNNHWNQEGDRRVCVHGFIGKLQDGSIASYQTLPWDMRGWHAGSGAKGSANDTHISFEICEDGLTNAEYFAAVYKEAVELSAYLCKLYGLKPLADGVIIGHYEGYDRGIASNHGDPRNWFPKFGKSMDSFRADVAALVGGQEPPKPERFPYEALVVTKTTPLNIWSDTKKTASLLQVKKGGTLTVIGGANLVGWYAVTKNGVYGYADGQYLERIQGSEEGIEPPAELVDVLVPRVDEETAKALLAQYPGAYVVKGDG